MSYVVKIYDTCIGCTECVKACPTDVLEMIEIESEPGTAPCLNVPCPWGFQNTTCGFYNAGIGACSKQNHQFASAPRVEDCVCCKRCETACPTEFLSVRVYHGDSMALSSAKGAESREGTTVAFPFIGGIEQPIYLYTRKSREHPAPSPNRDPDTRTTHSSLVMPKAKKSQGKFANGWVYLKVPMSFGKDQVFPMGEEQIPNPNKHPKVDDKPIKYDSIVLRIVDGKIVISQQ